MKPTPPTSSLAEQVALALSRTDADALDSALQLHEISTLLIQDRDVASLYGRIVDAAMELLSAGMGSMQVFHPERNELELVVWRGFHPASAAYWKWIGLDSDSSCGVALKSGSRVVVPDTEAWDLVAGTPGLEEYRRSGIRATQSTPLVSRSGRLLGMISTLWSEPHSPPASRLRLLDILARQAADLVERTRHEAELADNAHRLRRLASILELSTDAIESIGLDGTITSWNKGAERMFGYTADEAIGRPITLIIPPDRHAEEQDILARIRGGERIDNYETVRCRKDGSTLAISLSISPVMDAGGKIVGAAKIARDITERKRAEERIATLGREAEHRAKNILATVRATVNLSRANSAEELKQVIIGRVQALANVHALFAESRWVGAELSSLAAQELAPYLHGDEIRARIAGPQILLEPDAAQMIAMVLHELTTNAGKYGALSTTEGRVDIGWRRAADGCLVLGWTETGGPPVTAPKRQGFGTRVMQQMAKSLRDGGIHFDWRAEGLCCEITFRA